MKTFIFSRTIIPVKAIVRARVSLAPAVSSAIKIASETSPI